MDQKGSRANGWLSPLENLGARGGNKADGAHRSRGKCGCLGF